MISESYPDLRSLKKVNMTSKFEEAYPGLRSLKKSNLTSKLEEGYPDLDWVTRFSAAEPDPVRGRSAVAGGRGGKVERRPHGKLCVPQPPGVASVEIGECGLRISGFTSV